MYSLKPEIPLEAVADPDIALEHVYEEIHAFGKVASLIGVYNVKGSWRIERNWDFLEAVLVCPTMSSVRPQCLQFFGVQARHTLDPSSAQSLCALPSVGKRLALGDGPAATAAAEAICDQEMEQDEPSTTLPSSSTSPSTSSSATTLSTKPKDAVKSELRKPAPKKAQMALMQMRVSNEKGEDGQE